MRINRNNLTNLNALIRLEVDRAVESILESRLSPEDDEKHRQAQISKAIDDRNLRASDNKEAVEEAESDEQQDEEDSTETPKEPKKRKDRTGGKGTADSKKAETPKIQDLRKPSLTNFIDKLNIVRGGKSLKDPDVKKSFETYLGTLNVKEKQTMLVFLTAISQILIGKKQGAEALDPGEVGLRINSPTPPKVPRSEKEKSKSKIGTEEAPIVVGESQDKSKLKKVIEAYRSWK